MFTETLPLQWLYVCVAILGLIIGSFLNVVIYRLPLMIKKDWEIECQQYLSEKKQGKKTVINKGKVSFNLCTPVSHCPHCHTPLKWRDNIPLLSWIILKGKCRNCRHPISLRYPFVEILSALTSLTVVFCFGYSIYSLCLLVFTFTLIVLAFIDIDTLLLPDRITLPLMWGGIFIALVRITPLSLTESIIGVISGYLLLWTLFWVFKLATKKDGLGFGDLKLFAALGAWLGYQSLLFILLVASFLGAISGILQLFFSKEENRVRFFAFGPYLAFAAWIYLLFGDELISFYYQILLGINLG